MHIYCTLKVNKRNSTFIIPVDRKHVVGAAVGVCSVDGGVCAHTVFNTSVITTTTAATIAVGINTAIARGVHRVRTIIWE